MKFIILIFVSLVLFNCFSSCKKKDPEACFTFAKDTVNIGDTIVISNCSKNYTDVKWTLPQGGTSNAVNPKIIMGTLGVYEVNLTVGVNNFSKQSTLSKSIFVK